jgi:SAM-dependent methyltransferase
MRKLLKIIKRYFWEWPDGLVWKLTEKPTINSRKQKYELFIKLIKPKPEETILDVGVAPFVFRATNFLEQWYPYPERITAITNEDLSSYMEFKKYFPKVKLVWGDGCNLDFPDNYFDIVFCNAVVEHVGSRDLQKQFIREIVRVGKRAFITTPNYWFPVDFHTLIPFAHWLPEKVKSWIYIKFKREFYASKEHLNLLSYKTFLSLFPEDVNVKIIKQKFLGLTSNLIAIVSK